MGDIVVLLGFSMLSSFIGVCFYRAWYKPVEFEESLKWVDKTIDEGRIFWHALVLFVLAFTLWGCIYSWYQF